MNVTQNEKQSQLLIIRLSLIGILVLALALRWMLSFQGGQLFNPDEYRYLYCRDIAHDIQKGHFTSAITEMTREALHQGFKFLCVIPALVEMKLGQNLVIPALFFSLFSWVNIIIIWFLARRLGADETEALWAVVLAASSSALFYYASHLFPYDASMTCGLLALYVGLRDKPTAWTSVLTGILGFLSFYIYNGYWALVGLAFVVHLVIVIKPYQRLLLKALWVGIGFLVPLFLMGWVNKQYGNDLLGGYRETSAMITNGTFSEGGLLPFTYLWAAERFLLVLWLILIVYGLITYSKDRSLRILLWVASALFIYACLAVPSVILQKFVVYGRLVRQVVPFLVLASAYGLRKVGENLRWGRIALPAVLISIVILAGFNLQRPFQIVYPLDFAKQVKETYPDFKPPKNMTYFYTENVVDAGPYKAYYIKYIFPLPKDSVPVEGEILMSAENPLSAFPPFRYEDGYTLEERAHFPPFLSRMMVARPKP